MSNNTKHVSLRVYGKVQGVFFRASTEDKANELGLTGFVQNENDGSVYIEAEGDQEALKQLVQWAHEGPGRAKVEKVEVKEFEGSVGYEKFEQRRQA